MKSYINILTTIAILAAVSITTGCAMTNKNLVRDSIVKIEKIPSSAGAVGFVSVLNEGEVATIRGNVSRWPFGRSLIPGHIDVEIFNSSGATLVKLATNYRRPHGNSRYARFYTSLGIIPSSGSTIRVIHHNARFHRSS